VTIWAVMKQTDKHLLIDGYNMIHGIYHLSRIHEESQEAACQKLIQMARTIHDEDGIRVTVVFDGREQQLQLQRPCNRPTFSVIYAPRQLSADGVIEQLLARATNPEQISVASRDNMIREVAAARGAFSVDSLGLEEWVTRCQGRTRSRLGATKKGKWKTSLGDFWEMLGKLKEDESERG